MNLQQALQPKSAANGYGRRRVEREPSTKLENKLHSGKSNPSRSTNIGLLAGNKSLGYGSPSRDRLVYMMTCLIGHHVEVQLKNGTICHGIFHAADAEKDFGVILKMARMSKDCSLRRNESITKTVNVPSNTLVIPAKELVQVIAKDVSISRHGMSNELQSEKQQELLIDSYISQSGKVDAVRELERWIPDGDSPQSPELENIFEGPWNRWDQFETNEALFGVKSTFDEELYTTKLERGPQMRELEKEAVRIAREIEGEETRDHLAEERGYNLHGHFDMDEETRFSSVYRGTSADGRGYEEHEDLKVDLLNDETFGGSTDSGYGADERAGAVSSSSSLDEAQSFQSSIAAELYQTSCYGHAKQLASKHPTRSFPPSDGSNRVQEKFFGDLEENNDQRGFEEMQMQPDDVKISKSKASLSSPTEGDGFDKGGLSPDAAAYAPSRASSKGHGKMSSPSGLSESASSVSVSSRGRLSVSTPSTLDSMAAAQASSGPGLTPSSSVGSWSSEKSTLNPHAKEFKFNPNAKSFVPSQTSVRPPSPAGDGSFCFPNNASTVSQMHGMPVGIGIGPSFAAHQPIIFNPHAAPLQSPQAFVHPNGSQFGQQMLFGHPRQVMYMPGYTPELQQYKRSDF